MDFEARETRTAWSGDLFGETRRRFATPTTRLSLLASGLPGGITVRANVRASYRYDELVGGPPPLSIRAYEVAAIKSFERVPLEIMLGRFGNPYESYSAYWDGALVRLGRPSGIGVGMAVGFEPELHNEAFSRALPKLTAFADFAARGGGWRYDTDASFHVVRPSFGAERHFVGWSQRLSLGRLAISQRLRVDGSPTGGAWSLTELRLRGSLDLVGPLRLRSTYRRSGSTLMPPLQPMAPSAVRREMTVGLDLSGDRGSLSAEGGRTDRSGEEPGWSLYGSAGLRVRGAGLLLSGRRWARGDAESWSVAPALSFNVSVWEWRTGYRFYRTGSGRGTVSAHAAEGQVGVDVTRGMRVTLRGERQWGANLTGIRVRIGIWRSF
jgi:hypothetical protein